jgi:hypothetical protein
MELEKMGSTRAGAREAMGSQRLWVHGFIDTSGLQSQGTVG